MRKIYNYLLVAFLFISFSGLIAQPSYGSGEPIDKKSTPESDITITPLPFGVNDEITITINSDNSCNDMSTTDLFIWAGIGTEDDPWIYGSGNDDWNTTTEKEKFTNNGDGTHTIVLTPKTYFAIPNGEESTMKKMGLVFRTANGASKWEYSENGSCTGDDYFVGVGNFQIELISPIVANGGVLKMNSDETLNIKVTSTEDADFSIKEAGTEIYTAAGVKEIDFSKTVSETNSYTIDVNNGSEVKSISFSVVVESAPVVEALPSGMRDGINYHEGDDTKVTLVLQAPNKNFVYVKGDFSDWAIKGEYAMKRSTANSSDENTRYWITIDGLTQGEEYSFQYLVDGEIIIADPYTEKILDPWNDGWISDETYPNLKTYPKGKTEGIVSVFETGQTEYAWKNTEFVKPAKSNLIIYELLVRDFVHKHSYQSIIDTLDYLEKLNINAIELMPINEFEGNESWGYNPSFYFAPDKYYGPKNKLKEFIDEAHSRGIAVIIDLVLNHSEGSSPFLQLNMTPDYIPTDENLWYTAERSIPEATWGRDFDHESIHTQALVDSINSFWMKEYHVDGFRFDFTKGFTNTQHPNGTWGGAYDAQRISILKRMSDEIWNRNNDAYVIFEHLGGNQEEKELADHGIMLWGNMVHNYSEAAMGWNEGDKSDLSWASYIKRGWSKPHLVAYSSSHDEERIAYKNSEYGNSNGSYNIKELSTNMERMQLQAMFIWTIPGPKMIWQFDEVGYDYSIDFNGRVGNKPIKWDYTKDADRLRVYNLHKAIMKLKKTEAAFSTTNFTLDVDNGALKSIILEHNDMDVVIVGNFDVTAKTTSVTFPKTGTWYNYFAGSEYEVSTTSQSISLEAGEYKMFTTKKLDTPNLDESISLSIEEVAYNKNASKGPMSVYPVPVKGNATIKYSISEKSTVTIEVFNLQGQVVEQYKFNNQPKGTHTVNWQVDANSQEGVYFIRISTPVESFTRKISVE